MGNKIEIFLYISHKKISSAGGWAYRLFKLRCCYYGIVTNGYTRTIILPTVLPVSIWRCACFISSKGESFGDDGPEQALFHQSSDTGHFCPIEGHHDEEAGDAFCFRLGCYGFAETGRNA